MKLSPGRSRTGNRLREASFHFLFARLLAVITPQSMTSTMKARMGEAPWKALSEPCLEIFHHLHHLDQIQPHVHPHGFK
jgi:hypothetical protein